MADPWKLRPPAFHTGPAYEHSNGPQVAAVCEQAGYVPDPEQRLILDDLFAVTDEGLSSAFETAVVATRQQLKTGVEKQAAIGWMFVTQEETVTWSAHLFSTTQEAFRDLSALFTNVPMFRKRLALGPTNGIHAGNVNPHIELRDGRRLLFRSRTKSGGRGLTGDKMILDEALYLLAAHLGALIPTLTAVPDPQLLYGSSAGLAHSLVLREIRDRGRSGSPGLSYWEWCAQKRACVKDGCEHHKPSHPQHEFGCALDDEHLWAEASPLLGRRRSNGTGLTLAKMRKFREAEPPEEWMRERMGWWEDPGAAEIFGPGKWEICGAEPRPTPSRLGAIGLAVDVELSRAAVVAAGLAGAAGSRVAVRPLQHGAGVSWLIDRLKALQREHGAVVVLDGRGPAAQLVPQLKAAGIRYHAATTAEVLDAFDVFYLSVTDGTLIHADYPELNSAVDGATTRTAGSGGDRRTWGRRSSKSDITPLEAGTLATWWVARPKVSYVPVMPQSGEMSPHELETMRF